MNTAKQSTTENIKSQQNHEVNNNYQIHLNDITNDNNNQRGGTSCKATW